VDAVYSKSRLSQDIAEILESAQETEHDYDQELCESCSDEECYDSDYDCDCDCHEDYEGYVHDSARRITQYIITNIDTIYSLKKI